MKQTKAHYLHLPLSTALPAQRLHPHLSGDATPAFAGADLGFLDLWTGPDHGPVWTGHIFPLDKQPAAPDAGDLASCALYRPVIFDHRVIILVHGS